MNGLNGSCLEYRLTEEERQAFNETGMLTIEDALSPEQVAQGVAIVDRIYEAKVAEGHDARKALFYPNFIPDDSFFADLVDYEKVLPKVWGILGWNIYLYHAHLIVTPPSGQPQDDKTFGWHQCQAILSMLFSELLAGHLSYFRLKWVQRYTWDNAFRTLSSTINLQAKGPLGICMRVGLVFQVMW